MFRLLQEDGSSSLLLEDNSSEFLLEQSPFLLQEDDSSFVDLENDSGLVLLEAGEPSVLPPFISSTTTLFAPTVVAAGFVAPFIASVTQVYQPALPGETATFSSSTTWTAPDDVYSIKVEVWGGGGGGASQETSHGKAAGGGGAYSANNQVPVTPGNTYTVTVGAAGLAVADAAGQNGGTSSFVGDDGTTVSAVGGQGGGQGHYATAGPGGDAASGSGLTKFSGGSGGAGAAGVNTGGAGGGESGGPAGNGSAGQSSISGTDFPLRAGGTGHADAGDGGTGSGWANSPPGTVGQEPGGGGGGNASVLGAGRNGAIGQVRITFTPSILVQFLASTTQVFTPELQGSEITAPFVGSTTVVYEPSLVDLSVDVEGVGPGNGGEQWMLQLNSNGATETATLTADIGVAAGVTLHLSGDSGLPSSGTFPLRIDDEVITVRKTGAGAYGVSRRGLSNSTPAIHSSGASAVWDDTYLMAVESTLGMSQQAEVEEGLMDGWLIVFDASQGYIGSSRYPMHVAELLGVFPPGEGTVSSRLDGAQPSAVSTPTGLSDDCPAAMTVPARLEEDILAGDVAVCRYTNPDASVMTLGPRAAAIQGWYGFGRRDASDNNVTETDPNGTVVDGTAHDEFFETSFVTVTLPGDDRTFTYGPPRYSNEGWPIAALAVRHGKRRIPLWTSETWHNFNYVYTGFHADALFVQVLVNRNGFHAPPLGEVALPHPDDIDGPDATWDATNDYYTSTSWYVGITETEDFAIGPTLNGPPSPPTPVNPPITVVPGNPPGGGGGPSEPPGDDWEGGSGGDIDPPVGAGVHLHTDLGETGAFTNPPISLA